MHVILRAPREDELAALRRAASALLLRETREGAAAPPTTPPEAVAQFARGCLLTGDASSWGAALEGLRRARPALEAELRRALFPAPPRVWRLRTRELPLARPLVMGIVNVTPDSFSDGGHFLHADAAVAHARDLVAAGADVLDVGGESTRPGSQRIDEAEERARVRPVVRALAREGWVVSIDTSRASVASDALADGAEIVNDVSAFGLDPEIAGVVGESGAGAVLMHMRGVPATMQERPWYQDVAGEVLELLDAALERARAAGVDPERCAVDPGIGFGKRRDDNQELIRRLPELAGLGRPILVGPSRKGFLDPTKRRAPAELVPETVAVACLAAIGGARILRVHDVEECCRALDVVHRIQAWCGGEDEGPPGPTA